MPLFCGGLLKAEGDIAEVESLGEKNTTRVHNGADASIGCLLNNITKKILLCYASTILLAVLVVPRSLLYKGETLRIRYSFLFDLYFFDNPGWAIEYGIIALELVAITAIAALCYLLRDKIESLIERL